MNSVNHYQEVISIIPTVADQLEKQASAGEFFSTESKEDTLASALMVSYLTKVAHETVPFSVIERVSSAVTLYDLESELSKEESTMIKSASETTETSDTEDRLRIAENIIESDAYGVGVDLEKTASQAERLWDNFSNDIQSDTVTILSGNGFLVKEAAIAALTSRYLVSKNEGFNKIANIVRSSDETKLTCEDNRLIAKAVIELEKSAGVYQRNGFNFYKEAFCLPTEKTASLKIKLDKKEVSVDQVIGLGKSTLSNYLGKETADAIVGKDVAMAKSAISALPLDLKQTLEKML